MIFMYKVIDALTSNGVEYALVGGQALPFHGIVRATFDIDIVLRLDRENFKKAEKALTKIGLASKQPVSAEQMFDFREEYISNKNLKAWTFQNSNDPSELVDIIITYDLKDISTKRFRSGRHSIPVISREGLIKMKRAAGREQDIEDIRALEKQK